MNPISAQQILRVALLVLVSCAQVALVEKPEPETSQVTQQLDWIFDDTRAYEDVEYFTQFCRIAGGPGFDSCLKYIESNLGLARPPTDCDSHDSLVLVLYFTITVTYLLPNRNCSAYRALETQSLFWMMDPTKSPLRRLHV